MNISPDYVPADSMYLTIFAPTLGAALAGMENAMRVLDWASPYIDYVMGNVNEQDITTGQTVKVKHTISPISIIIDEETAWILEIPVYIAKKICQPMRQWLIDNPNRLKNVDLLTHEQMIAVKNEVEI
jgi:hypothetical protein